MYSTNNDNLLKSARECFDKHEYKRARLLLSEIIESDDKNVEALFMLANGLTLNRQKWK